MKGEEVRGGVAQPVRLHKAREVLSWGVQLDFIL